MFYQEESLSALDICMEILDVRNSHTCLSYIHILTLKHTQNWSHVSWPAQTSWILHILDVSDPLTVWLNHAVHQEYSQYSLKVILLVLHSGVQMALFLPGSL